MFNLLKQDSELITINLLFNETFSKYEIVNESESLDIARIVALGDKNIFYSKQQNTFFYNNAEFFYRIPENKYIISKQNELDWKIHTDFKIINDIVCYRATSTYKELNTKGNDDTKYVTAWFAPTLNLNYGPAFFNNLPGLIMEVQYDNYFLLGLKKIKYTSCEEIMIKMDLKGDNINFIEYEAIQKPILIEEHKLLKL